MSTVQNQQDPLDREYAPGWRPAEGEVVRGVVVDLDLTQRDATYGGGEYPVVTIRLADAFSATTKHGTVTDEVGLHCLHSQLAGKLAAIRPKVGDSIGVKFVGEPVGEARAKRYRADMSTDGGGEPSGAFDWRDYAFPDDGEPDRQAPVSDVPADTAELDTNAERLR